MRVAVYARVSTDEQNIEGQEQVIRQWLASNNVTTNYTWFEDKGVSGETINRPALRRLQRGVQEGKFDTVVVYRLDRLSRSMVDGVNMLSTWLKDGVRIVSVTENLDFAGTVGQMVAAVLLAVAQMETEVRRQRQAHGIAAAKVNGVYKGRKPGSFKGNPQQVKALRSRGWTYSEIAKQLGVSLRTAKRYAEM